MKSCDAKANTSYSLYMWTQNLQTSAIFPGPNFFLKIFADKGEWAEEKRGTRPVALSKIARIPAFLEKIAAATGLRCKFAPLAEYFTSILFFFKKCLRDIYYISGPLLLFRG